VRIIYGILRDGEPSTASDFQVSDVRTSNLGEGQITKRRDKAGPTTGTATTAAAEKTIVKQRTPP